MELRVRLLTQATQSLFFWYVIVDAKYLSTGETNPHVIVDQYAQFSANTTSIASIKLIFRYDMMMMMIIIIVIS